MITVSPSPLLPLRSLQTLSIVQADLETKELRDAARLEASRRAKLEADAKIREQKAQRQAEVEQRREQERAEKEARDARERREKEARRLAAVAEAKAKAAHEVMFLFCDITAVAVVTIFYRLRQCSGWVYATPSESVCRAGCRRVVFYVLV